MNVIEKCIVCGSVNIGVRYKANFQGNLNDAPKYFLAGREFVAHGQINQCNSCNFLFTSPQFEAQDYEKIYSLAARNQNSLISHDEAERVRGEKIANILSRFIKPTSSLLDFGCSEGGFLKSINAGKKCGVEVVSLKGHNEVDADFLIGNLRSLYKRGLLKNDTFDVITAIDVFEHLPLLNEYLETLIKLLRPGGILFLTLPNADSFSARILGSRWSMYLLEHLWYFSPRTLSQWLTKYGFSTIETGSLFYDVPLSHVLNRITRSPSQRRSLINSLASKKILPIPVGLMYGVFRKM